MPAIEQIQSRARDAGVFLKEFFREFRDTGSITPSSAALSNALTRSLEQRTSREPLTILEVGAGTGPVSKAIARRMGTKDTLELVESNDRLADRLQDLLIDDDELAGVADRVSLHRARVEELDRTERYDVIISGLPFANFTAEEVREIMEAYFAMLRPGGTLSFYGYLGTKQIRAVAARREDYLRQVRSGWVVDEYLARYGEADDRVIANVPPAWIHHLRKPLD
ncbi:methyltransferase domain-containing protein [Spiractinospora alimapuensis]|uniref:class I SAM-dependent methyltransferase n=1 Tax=Spiractinospora alimapuensis TaxID=2820884 RepID=UPI001F2DB5A2|nr:methyltransferase domain-containing protein [Spiractinospora alimapuensis]QVQ50338.1 methyltransferase domain-containing protein [Spiractinospora alimapuensis]